MARVFVLGAGASIAVISSAPGNNQLLPEALKLAADPRIQTIAEFIDDFYWQKAVPPLEDILTQIDICIVENRSISAEYNLIKLGELRENLVYAICKVLENTLERQHPFDPLPPLPVMEKFISKLGSEDTIISLNYDLIVDNSIMRETDANLRVPDYGFPVRYYADMLGDFWDNFTEFFQSKLASSQTIPLLKLHGSLNWLYCPACRAIDVTPGKKGAVYIFQNVDSIHCPHCGVRYEPYIVTPTFLKNYGNLYLSQIWQQAEERLSRADAIVFIGYSLPDADIILRTMLSRAVYRHRHLKQPFTYTPLSPVEVRVVSNSQESRSRYEKLFGEIPYSDQGFEHYINQEMQSAAQR